MKALTIKQPYASLIMNGTKVFEMRSWRPKEPIEFAVHAAAKPVDVLDLLNSDLDSKHWDGLFQPLGYVLGIVKVVEYVDTLTMTGRMYLSWDHGLHPLTVDSKEYRWAWKLQVVEVFTKPIPAKGKLGLWDWHFDRELVKG